MSNMKMCPSKFCAQELLVYLDIILSKCLILILTWAIWKWSCSMQVVGFDDLDTFSLQSSIQSLCLVTWPLLSNLAPAQCLNETRVWFLQGVETLLSWWPFCNAQSPSVVWRAHFYFGPLYIFFLETHEWQSSYCNRVGSTDSTTFARLAHGQGL